MAVIRPKSIFESDAIWLFFIFTAGLILRLFQLTNPTFWIDEIGVQQAALQPSWQQAMQIAKDHIMGMPLHYLQTWIAGQLGLQNEWLRLPDALWGSLTILVGYRLAKYYVEKSAALITAALIATSPLLIRYSQELRFYAGLYFFQLSLIFTSLRAIERGKWYNWGIVLLFGTIGILFHPYTIFGLAFAYGILVTKPEWYSLQIIRRLLLVTILLLGFFGWAVLQFGSVPGYYTPLFALENPLNFLFRGLGLAPIHFPTGMTLLYYAVLGSAFIVGIGVVIKNQNRRIFLCFVISAGILGLILGMNWYRHYFVHSRQIYFLSFWVYLTAACGLISVKNRFMKERNLSAENMSAHKWLAGLMILIGLISTPALSQYYNAERTIVRSAYQPLIEQWQAGDWICVIPDFDLFVFTTYWQNDLGQWLLPCNQMEVIQNQQIRFVIANEEMDFSPAFREIFRPPADTFYPKRIWMRGD